MRLSLFCVATLLPLSLFAQQPAGDAIGWPGLALAAPTTGVLEPASIQVVPGYQQEVVATFSYRCVASLLAPMTSTGCVTLAGDFRTTAMRSGTLIDNAGDTFLYGQQTNPLGFFAAGIDMLVEGPRNQSSVAGLATVNDAQLSCRYAPSGTEVDRIERNILGISFNLPLNALNVVTKNSRIVYTTPNPFASGFTCPEWSSPQTDGSFLLGIGGYSSAILGVQDVTIALIRVTGAFPAHPR